MQPPTIYHYDSVTGELVGIGYADPDPLTPGEWLFPAQSTEVAPPLAQAGKARVWDGEAWALLPDHRGETWWSGPNEPVVVNFIGDPALQLLVSANPFTPSFEEVRTAKLAALSAKRYAVETGGTTFSGMPVRTDRETSAIITAAFVSAMADPEFQIGNWKIADGVFITLDAATIFALAGAIRGHVQAAFNREAELSAEIVALETVEALNDFDIDAEW